MEFIADAFASKAHAKYVLIEITDMLHRCNSSLMLEYWNQLTADIQARFRKFDEDAGFNNADSSYYGLLEKAVAEQERYIEQVENEKECYAVFSE